MPQQPIPDRLTPTQDLIMEVLAARFRLGERTWTFDDHSAIRKAMRVLEERGLVTWKSGITENTLRAWMTEAGRAEYVTADYVPPILRPEEP